MFAFTVLPMVWRKSAGRSLFRKGKRMNEKDGEKGFYFLISKGTISHKWSRNMTRLVGGGK